MNEQLANFADFVNYNYSRSSIIFSIFNNISKILRAIKDNPNASYEEFKKMLKISGGALHLRLKDAQIMKLYTNGYGKHLTELGERWLKESEDMGGMPTEKTIKEACLNIPLFNFVYRQHSELTTPNKLFLLFKEYTRDNPVGDKYLAMSVRRYLEGIHNLKVKKRLKIRPRKSIFKLQKEPMKLVTPLEMMSSKNKFTIQEFILFEKSINDLINKFGFDNIEEYIKSKKL